ncbi:MAG: hypothetical protein EA360_04480 [Balneolaceae bacterium]|nr:MAG: hypothetical protein EA360_04480 [Balneolaceae bacterium]
MFFFCSFILPDQTRGQEKAYELLPSPDMWYNSVDGIRIGVNFVGQVPGTFEDGPHRLNAGVWLGLWFPSMPVSYQLLYTEPVPGWSEFGSEASVQFLSSIRTGYHRHGAGFNKRWQPGFQENKFRELNIFNTFEKRFNRSYTAFPALWSEDSKILATAAFKMQDENFLGLYFFELESSLQYLNDSFIVSSLTAFQKIDLNRHWGFRFRAFTGVNSSASAPEYLYSRSMNPAIRWMNNGVTRAKGTIPQNWIESGSLHIAGGANIRGYMHSDVKSFVECENEVELCSSLYHSILSFNAEFDFWNPVDALLNKNNYASEFLRFRSYLFYDTGSSTGWIGDQPAEIFSNAGAGISFSLNIPDYLGKSRGFVLRYEMPFWISDPTNGNSISFRSLFGFGAVIAF